MQIFFVIFLILVSCPKVFAEEDKSDPKNFNPALLDQELRKRVIAEENVLYAIRNYNIVLTQIKATNDKNREAFEKVLQMQKENEEAERKRRESYNRYLRVSGGPLLPKSLDYLEQEAWFSSWVSDEPRWNDLMMSPIKTRLNGNIARQILPRLTAVEAAPQLSKIERAQISQIARRLLESDKSDAHFVANIERELVLLDQRIQFSVRLGISLPLITKVSAREAMRAYRGPNILERCRLVVQKFTHSQIKAWGQR